jgi:ribose transport system substrate-binding protein
MSSTDSARSGGRRSSRGLTGLTLVIAAVLAAALALTACGGGSSSSSSTSASTASNEGSGEGASGVAKAKESVASYLGKPSAFPVTEALKELPKGATVAYVEATGTAVGALFWEVLQPAGKEMGVKLLRIKAGSSASTVSSAFDSLVAQKPDAVIVTAIPVELWKNQLKELQAENVPVVTTGVTGTEPFGIEAPQAAEAASELEGKLMANYAVAEMSPEADVAMYDTPELPFTLIVAEAFESELGVACPNCSVRTVQIPITEIGTTAPNTIVSDLQAHPETTIAAFADDEISVGTPTAMQSAGIDVETLGNAPGPTELQYLKEGKQTAALGVDLPVLIWTTLDQAARALTGQKLTGPEAEGLSVVQFLTAEDITFDPSNGWTGYPTFPEMFAKLWGVAG